MIECICPCIDIDLWSTFRSENDLIIVEKTSTIPEYKEKTVIQIPKEYENYEPEDYEDTIELDIDEEELYFFVGKKLRS
jgi:hypothetical protein